MSELIGGTTNLNVQQSPQNHYFVIEKYPSVAYDVVDVATPDISLGKIDISTPFYILKKTGTALHFSDLNFTFLVDEELTNYIQMYKWVLALKELQVLTDTIQNQVESEMQKISSFITTMKSDCELHLLTNKKNDQVIFRFEDCFPTSISGISLSTKSGPEVLVCTVTMAFDSFTLKKEAT